MENPEESTDNESCNESVTSARTPRITTLSVPAGATNPDTPRSAYTLGSPHPQEMSDTPPALPLPLLPFASTPSPLASPTPHGRNTQHPGVLGAQLPTQNIFQMEVDDSNLPAYPPPHAPATDNNAQPEERDNYAPPADLRSILTAATAYWNSTSNRDTRSMPRNPLNKYTDAIMPKVHTAHPTAVFDHVDHDQVDEWVARPGTKLLAIPFGTEVRSPDRHTNISGRILAAAAEITQSQRLGVAAPKANETATQSNQTPISFLIYNLTVEQARTLLQREVWSAPAITFRVSRLEPICTDYLFTIDNLSTKDTEDVHKMVLTTWQNDETFDSIQELLQTWNPEDHPQPNVFNFIASARVEYLEYMVDEHTLAPKFNIYADSSLIPNHILWSQIRALLASRPYTSPIHGPGVALIAPFNCGACQGTDHPRGFCPFPIIPGWNGPPRREYRRPRGGRGRGNAKPRRGGRWT